MFQSTFKFIYSMHSVHYRDSFLNASFQVYMSVLLMLLLLLLLMLLLLLLYFLCILEYIYILFMLFVYVRHSPVENEFLYFFKSDNKLS